MSEPEANGLAGAMFQPGGEQLALIDEGFCIGASGRMGASGSC